MDVESDDEMVNESMSSGTAHKYKRPMKKESEAIFRIIIIVQHFSRFTLLISSAIASSIQGGPERTEQ